MRVSDLRLTQALAPLGLRVVWFGDPLLDAYLDFGPARCRPKTVLAPAHDLNVSFTVVVKEPAELVVPDVLGFIIARRVGAPASCTLPTAHDGVGVSGRTVRRRVSSVVGLYAWTMAGCYQRRD